MNNYFGLGLDAKIALEFHQKREGCSDKARFVLLSPCHGDETVESTVDYGASALEVENTDYGT